MKRVALVFVIAVLIPCLTLAWLAVRSLGDQHVVFERQQSLLCQGVTDLLAGRIQAQLDEQQREFALRVEQMLSQSSTAEVATAFDDRLCADWPAAKVGFAVALGGGIISPSPAAGRPESRGFLRDNEKFLTGTENAEILYLNNKQPQKAPPPSSRYDTSTLDGLNSTPDKQLSYKKSPSVNRSQMTPATRNVAPKSEWSRNDQALNVAGVQQAQLSRLVTSEGEFQQLAGDTSEGSLARFVDNKLVVLLWYRAAREPRYVFGAQLDLTRLKDGLRDLLPGIEPALREDICVAIIDDRARPVALSHPDFEADWKHPFVATEIGEVLPHWEIAACLLNPEKLNQAARTTKLVLGLLIGVLVLAIGVGSWLIGRDINRQLTLARQKTDFVSNVSHELKTPLTSIRMFAELLAEGRVSDPAKQRSYLSIITAETARLTRLINNVLDFARMDQGEKTYNFSHCDIARLAHDTAETYRPHLEQTGFTLKCSDPGQPLPVRGDADALAQVIVNLLSNAEKYSNGSKEIAVEVSRSEGANPSAEVRVLDRGPGVPRGAEEKIFEKFHRACDSLSSGIQGSGLGLTLARQIARAHGGDVIYEPRDGGGSCFTLRLPVSSDSVAADVRRL